MDIHLSVMIKSAEFTVILESVKNEIFPFCSLAHFKIFLFGPKPLGHANDR